MQLHVAVPGLLWPKDSIREVARELRLPALAALLGRGRIDWRPSEPAEVWLCGNFGVNAEERPCAALRMLGEGTHPGARPWICADPVPVRFARDTLIVGDPADLQLAPGETEAMLAALNEHFRELGEFTAPQPGRWYLRLKHLPQMRTHPLSTVIGRPLEPFLPQGPAAREWRRIMNEAQILLHNHPVNTAREQAGRPIANSIWLWGAGSLPALAAAPARKVCADDPIALGLAKLASVPSQSVPPSADDLLGAATDGCFVLLEELAQAAHALDMERWRRHVAALEQGWFAPLLRALESRELQRLRLVALGDDGIAEITLDAAELWKFWRRPRTLQSFAAEAPGR